MKNKGEFEASVLKLNERLPSGHIYTTENVDMALNSDLLNELLSMRSLFGEAHVGHLPYSEERNHHYFETSTTDIAISIVDIYIEDDYLKIQYDVLNTIKGNLLREAINNKTEIKFYTRAVGDLEFVDDVTYKVVGMILCTVDVVINPVTE